MRRYLPSPRHLSFVVLALLAGAVLTSAAACEPPAIGQRALSSALLSPGAQAATPSASPAPSIYRDCSTCHVLDEQVVRTKPMPVIPHQVAGWERCSYCHGAGRLASIPTSHAGATDDQCQACHRPSENPPPRMTHLAFKNRTCGSCHGPIVKLTATHDTRSPATCELCHQPAVTTPPALPHNEATTGACLSCHGEGQRLALAPAHRSRKPQLCTMCHEQPSGGTPLIPHTLDNRSNCVDCHGPVTAAVLSDRLKSILP